MTDHPQIQAQPTEVKLTLSVTRAATGETETIELIGHLTTTQEEQK